MAYWANQEVNPAAAEGPHNKLRKIFDKPYIVARDPEDNAPNSLCGM